MLEEISSSVGSFSSLADINIQAMKWLKRVNSSVHGTTHEIPLDRLKIEELNQKIFRTL